MHMRNWKQYKAQPVPFGTGYAYLYLIMLSETSMFI